MKEIQFLSFLFKDNIQNKGCFDISGGTVYVRLPPY